MAEAITKVVKKVLRARCLVCKTLKPLAELQFIHDGHTGVQQSKEFRVCSVCRPAHCSNCTSCNNLYLAGHVQARRINADDEESYEKILCFNCENNRYYQCNGCGNLSDHEYENDEGRCWNCGRGINPNRPMELMVDMNRYKKVYDTDRSYGEVIKSTRKFGVEFEVVPVTTTRQSYQAILKKTPAIIPDCWGVTTDASLNGGGIEIQSAPMRMGKGERTLMEFCGKVSKIGWKVDASCGLHVHLDGAELLADSVLLRRAFLTYYVMDKIVLAMIPKERRSNRFCSPLDKKIAIINREHGFDKGFNLAEIMGTKTKTDFLKTYYKKGTGAGLTNAMNNHQTEPRYYGINFHSLWDIGTVEIRYHEGTINGRDIINWVAFHQHMLDTARKITDEQAIRLYYIVDKMECIREYARLTDMPPNLIEYAINRMCSFK